MENTETTPVEQVAPTENTYPKHTAKWWFNRFPEPWRTRALNGIFLKNDDRIFYSAEKALWDGINFDSEGATRDEWFAFYEKIKSEEILISPEPEEGQEDKPQPDWEAIAALPNLIPFDLEKAKAGAKVVTRKGDNPRIICHDADGEFPVICLIKHGESEIITRNRIDGTCQIGEEFDLFHPAERKRGWVNICKIEDGSIICNSVIFDSENKAKNACKPIGVEVMNIVPVEWTECIYEKGENNS